MDIDIQILNVLDWSKNDREGSTLVYLINGKDYFQENDNFLGYATITNFYDKKIRHLIPANCVGKNIKGTLKVTRSFKDPTRTFSKLESIVFNNETISLL